MKFQQILALSVAVTASVLAANLSSQYLASAKKTVVVKEAPEVKMVTVVTAAKKLYHGRLLKKEDLKLVKWPADSAPKRSYRTIRQIFRSGEDRITLSHFSPGEVITDGRISGPGERPSLSHMLGKGMRAVAVKINAVLGVGGFVAPGDRVDVLLTERKSEDEGGREESSRVLLTNVRVLAIDQATEDPEFKPKVASTVTLEVTLPDAQKVALASTVGFLTLALRSMEPADTKEPVAAKIEQKPIGPKTVIVYRARESKPTSYDVPRSYAGLAR